MSEYFDPETGDTTNTSNDFSVDLPDQSSSGSGFGSVITALASNPITGLAVGGVSLVLSGINAVLNHRQAERDRKEKQRRYEQQLAIDQRDYELNLAKWQEQTKLSRAQLQAQLKQQGVENSRYIEATNEERKNQWYDKFTKKLNEPVMANKLLQIYGGK
jgi:phosphoribosylformimino-5-aminoimidazole carboxamide ribonucleotide (ProFAR) isomerase